MSVLTDNSNSKSFSDMALRLKDYQLDSRLCYKEGLAYWYNGQKELPLQSKRHPLEESQRLVTHWLQGEHNTPKVLTLIGAANTFIIKAIADRLPQSSELIVIEPDPAILKTVLENSDLMAYDSPIPIHLICEQDDNRLMQVFRKVLSGTPILCTGLHIHPALLRLRPDLKLTEDVLIRALKIDAMDRGTVASYSDEWLQNSIINLPEICRSPGVKQLINKYEGQDAFVVCAGPSLEDSLKIIKAAQDKALIICVGTALRPLLSAGVKPHITIIVDSDPKVYKQFEGIDDPPGYLLCTYTIFPGIIQKFKDRLIYYNCIVSKAFSQWLDRADINHGHLNVGGTVSLSALDLARICNCKNIFTVGLDLAYADDGTSHAKNSMYDNVKVTKGLVKVKGNRQEYVQTTKQFARYIDILNSFLQEKFSHFNGKLYNVNNSGARFQYMELIKPEECTDKMTDSRSIKPPEKIIHVSPAQIDNIKLLCQQSSKDLKDLKEESEQLLVELHEGQIPAGIENFENKVRNSDVCSQLLNQAMQAWCMQVSSGFEKDPHKLTLSFVEQINGAADWVVGLLENSLKRINNIKQGV